MPSSGKRFQEKAFFYTSQPGVLRFGIITKISIGDTIDNITN